MYFEAGFLSLKGNLELDLEDKNNLNEEIKKGEIFYYSRALYFIGKDVDSTTFSFPNYVTVGNIIQKEEFVKTMKSLIPKDYPSKLIIVDDTPKKEKKSGGWKTLKILERVKALKRYRMVKRLKKLKGLKN